MAANGAVPGAIQELPSLPRDQEGPVFSEPWEAHAFALAVRLSEAGFFSWREWTAFLTQEIRAAQMRSEPDLGSNYYLSLPKISSVQLRRRRERRTAARSWTVSGRDCGRRPSWLP